MTSKDLLKNLIKLDEDLDKPIIVNSGLMKFMVNGIHIQRGGDFDGAIVLTIVSPQDMSGDPK